MAGLRQRLEAGKLAIVYLDRAVFGMAPRRRRSYIPRDPKIHTVIPTAASVQEERLIRIPTSELNTLIREATLKHAPTR